MVTSESKAQGVMPLQDPVSTYRLQFHKDFTFHSAQNLLPYLKNLGVTHLYCSPVFTARAGSQHGYDVTDPTRIHPVLGGEKGFVELAENARQNGMGILLDLVPNHMAADPENPWWWDLLANGPASSYAHFFDVEWQVEHPKLILPVLGETLESELAGDKLCIEPSRDGACVVYDGHRFPLEPRSLQPYWRRALGCLRREAGNAEERGALERLGESLDRLSPFSETGIDQKRARAEIHRSRLSLFQIPSETTGAFQQQLVRELNGAVKNLLTQQAYVLEHWKSGIHRLNYRRFFDISDLVAVRVEDPEVFLETHRLLFELIEKDYVQGIRVDHIDGLYDPGQYLRNLRERLAGLGKKDFYLVIEKILEGHESLNLNWPTNGTTGYDFLNAVNNFLVDPTGYGLLVETYRKIGGPAEPVEAQLADVKRWILGHSFRAEWERLCRRLHRLSAEDAELSVFPVEKVTDALLELTLLLPTYRTYLSESAGDGLLAKLVPLAPAELRPCLEFLKNRLLKKFPVAATSAHVVEWNDWTHRWEQFTGPLMAKSLEDTLLYRYYPLAALNEVGGNPEWQPVRAQALHSYFKTKESLIPLSMNTTSTHDTKRSEDTRSRLLAMAALSGEFLSTFEKIKSALIGDGVTPGHAWFIWQSLLAVWPEENTADEEAEVCRRLEAYFSKAFREAKQETNWLDPDSDFENAVQSKLRGLVQAGLLQTPDIQAFRRKLGELGSQYALIQAVLKFTAPGVSDLYQGCEGESLSLVDPDNRRPVDYEPLQRALRRVTGKDFNPTACKDARDLKLFVHHKLLTLRRDHADLFLKGAYVPVEIRGPRPEHFFGFRRVGEQNELLVLVATRPGPRKSFLKEACEHTLESDRTWKGGLSDNSFHPTGPTRAASFLEFELPFGVWLS